MTSESITQTGRGGCLDALVSAATLGHFGVETTVKSPTRPIRPSVILNSSEGFPVDPYSPIGISIRTREAVVINDFRRANEPEVTLRIIRTKPPR